jgi:hypothetical protein
MKLHGLKRKSLDFIHGMVLCLYSMNTILLMYSMGHHKIQVLILLLLYVRFTNYAQKECDTCTLNVEASNILRLTEIINKHLTDPSTDFHILQIDTK